MYDSNIRYLASAFVDADSIVPNPQHALELLKAFGSAKFLPTMVNELSPTGPTPRLGFRALDGTSQIILSGKRFDVSVLSKSPEGSSDLGEFSDFCREAKSLLTVSLNFFQRKAHRLAAVQEGLLQVMSSQEMDAIALRLLNFSPLYKQMLPFEWDWRAASVVAREFSRVREPTNTITTIKRIRGQKVEVGEGQFSETPFDRIRVDLDINTAPTNTVARFEEQQIASFFDHAPIWHIELISDVSHFISGG